MSSDRNRIWWLIKELYSFTMPKGDRFIRNRIFLALACLIIARVSAALIPQIYGRVIDAVNTPAGFTMGVLVALVGGYMLVRFGEQAFEELKEFLIKWSTRKLFRQNCCHGTWRSVRLSARGRAPELKFEKCA